MRQVLTRAAVALALGALALAPAASAGGAPDAKGAPVAVQAAATPSLTVTPATGLVSGQTVTVSATGLAATGYLFVECPSGATDTTTACETGGARGTGSPFAGGSFSFSTQVQRRIAFAGRRIDCATVAGGCEMVAVASEQGPDVVARASLQFDPDGALPATTVTATPHTGLVNGQSIHVTGTGFDGGQSVVVSVCAAGDAVCSGAGVETGGGILGSIGVTITAHVRVRDLDGHLTDCLAIACVVQAIDRSDADYEAVTPVTFDASTPVPPLPTLTVTPHTGLLHNQQVQVAGKDFDPKSIVRLGVCPADPTEVCPLPVIVNADTAGAFSTTMTVSRLVGLYRGGPEPTVADCASVGCRILAEGSVVPGDFALDADAAITFDTSVPPPSHPAVTVTPDHDLPYLADVAVHGTGFTPGQTIHALECFERDNTAFCQGVLGVPGTPAADGTFDLTLPVRRRAYDGPSVRDCADPGWRCYVRIDSTRDTEQLQADLTFDPNLPPPPAPTASVAPDHDLQYVQTVAVHGTGFTPGLQVPVSECSFSSGLLVGGRCKGLPELTADAAGNVSGSETVTRLLRDDSITGSFDCVSSSSPCRLVVGPQLGPDDTATAPLQFDPNSVPPSNPEVTVTPRTHLFDGQHVTVAGTHFAPGRLVGITECRLGASSLSGECDLSQLRLATTDATGAFSRRFVTKSVAVTPSGHYDCSRRPGDCVILAANPADFQVASVPISFDAPQLSVHGVGIVEGTGGTTAAPVRVTLSAPDRNPITVHWQAEPETAGPADYVTASGTVTIPAGSTAVTIDPRVVADASDEATETFRVRVTTALGTRVVDPTGVVTIHDDDPTPTVAIRDTGRREDGVEAHAEVTLSAPSGRTVVVHYVTHDGSARAGSDYVRKDAQLVFAPGETRHVVRVVLVDDRVHESTETFTVQIDRADNATVARGTATVTITDDD